MDILEKIGKIGLVPVVVLDDADDAVPAAKALMDGGLPIMEITMRTAAGIQSIKNVREAYPDDVLVGAGTILTLEKCKEAVEAGAQFIVSPGFNPEIVSWCVENNVPITPGCVTPTEIEQALAYGIKTVKFFPANVYGGISACKALQGPYKSAGVKFIPTGGVNNDNLADFADKPFIHAIGGGWLFNPSDVKKKDWAALTETAKKSIDVLLGFELAHIGINTDNDSEASKLAATLNNAFGLPVKEGNSSIFAGDIEINKSKGLGACGHIAIRTHSIERAAYYLAKKGYELEPGTEKYKGDKLIAVYLKGEFGGFAIHLLQK